MQKRKRKGNYDGKPGALARARSMSAERRKEIAVKAATTRWVKQNGNKGTKAS